MKRLFLLFLLIVSFAMSGLASQGSTDWVVHETDRAVFVYQKGVEDLVVEIVSFVEGVLDIFSEEYRTKLKQAMVFVLTGCNDVGIVRMLSPYKIYVGVTQDHNPNWFSGSWIRSRIAFEVARTFVLDLILSDTNRVVRSLKEYSALNLFLPVWFVDGLSYLGLRRVIDVPDDINSRSMLAFHLRSSDPFSNESLISGFVPGGTLPRTIFAITFMDYLASSFGEEKILELIHYSGSGLNMLLGIDRAFLEVFGRDYQTLREAFVRHQRTLMPAEHCAASPIAGELFEADMVQAVKVFHGESHYSVLNTLTGVTRLISEGNTLFSTEEEILDFSLVDGTTAITLLEEVEGCLQGRLYTTEDGQDLSLIQSRVVSAQFLGKDRLAMLVNDSGRYYLESYSLRTGRRVRLYDSVCPFSWMGQLSVSPSGRYVAAKIFTESRSLLLIYDASLQQTRLLDFGFDLNLGSWSREQLAVSVVGGNESYLGLFNPSKDSIVASSSLPGLCLWPKLQNDTYYAVSILCGFRVIPALEILSVMELKGELIECIRSDDRIIYDARPYSLFVDWQNVYTIPERLGVGTVLEDLLGTTRTMLSFGVDGSLSKPFLGLEISSRRLSIVDLEVSFFAAQSGSFAELTLARDYGITRKISAGWAATIQYPFKASLSLSGSLSDSALLLGGLSRASATVSLRDTQTLTANTVDGMLELKALWRNDNITLNAAGVTRFAVGDPSSVPIRFKGFQSEASILAGFSVGFEYPLSRRDINYGQIIHFSAEGYGIDAALLFAESAMWRLLVYKYETIYLYSRARLRFQLGVNLGSDGALPYFEISFPFSD